MVPDHVLGESIAVRMIAAKSYHDYNYITDFEIWRENQEFDCQFFSMCQPSLDSTPIGMKTTNLIMSHLESTPIGTKTPDPKPLTLPTDLSKCKKKTHVPEDQETDPSFSDLSSSEFDLFNDSKFSKY